MVDVAVKSIASPQVTPAKFETELCKYSYKIDFS